MYTYTVGLTRYEKGRRGKQGRKRGGTGEYMGTWESGRKQVRQRFLAIAALGLASWQVTEWWGWGGEGGSSGSCFGPGAHSDLLGTSILKPLFSPDNSSLLWKKQPSREALSSLKSKIQTKCLQRLLIPSHSFLPETSLSQPWLLKFLNPKLK